MEPTEKEFLTKLKDLMIEYNVEIATQYCYHELYINFKSGGEHYVDDTINKETLTELIEEIRASKNTMELIKDHPQLVEKTEYGKPVSEIYKPKKLMAHIPGEWIKVSKEEMDILKKDTETVRQSKQDIEELCSSAAQIIDKYSSK